MTLLAILIPMFAGLLSFLLGEKYARFRMPLTLLLSFMQVALVVWLGQSTLEGTNSEWSFPLGGSMYFVLRADPLALLFLGLASSLWFITTIYAEGYLDPGPQGARFFGFFGWCVAAASGVALAGNLFTFFIFYEFLTLSTWPLVVHSGTPEALAGGRTYLKYTMGGGALLLVGMVILHNLAGPVDFANTHALASLPQSQHGILVLVFALMVIGLGVKAAIFPLHGWLPKAMVAPAPVSALLHAVAVVKAGAFGVARIVHHVYGVELALNLGLLLPLVAAASFTIVYGSLRALSQEDLKKRLAFSTVSQVSYVVLGIALGSAVAGIGGLVHLVHQALMKITLFFCAGLLAKTLHIKSVSQINGVGKRMPLTFLAFTIGALGMIGAPPIAGFISKWYLGMGALQAGQPWVVLVLIISTLLNAAYFLPLVYRGWFLEPSQPWEEPTKNFWEADWRMLIPALITAFFSLVMGLAAGSPAGPLNLAKTVLGVGEVSW